MEAEKEMGAYIDALTDKTPFFKTHAGK